MLRRHWRVVAGWAGFNVMAMVCMVVVTVIVALVAAALTRGGVASPSEFSGVLGGTVALFGTFVVEIVLMAGLYRLLLRPEQPAFLHLRLGADELRMLGVLMILALGVAALAAVTALVGAVVRPIAGWLAFATTFVGAAAGVWLALRLALAMPITFASGRLGFAQSWRLTRGHVAALMGMSLLAVCVAAVIAIAAWLALFVVLGLAMGFRGLIDAILSGAEAPAGFSLAQIAVELILAPVLGVICQTPFVAVYQALSRAPAEA